MVCRCEGYEGEGEGHGMAFYLTLSDWYGLQNVDMERRIQHYSFAEVTALAASILSF